MTKKDSGLVDKRNEALKKKVELFKKRIKTTFGLKEDVFGFILIFTRNGLLTQVSSSINAQESVGMLEFAKIQALDRMRCDSLPEKFETKTKERTNENARHITKTGKTKKRN